MKRTALSRRGRARRRGAVVVEFAICVPVLLLFFFAALEFGRVNMIRQSVENAVYEGSRRGIVPGATAADCINSSQDVLNSIAAHGADISVDPDVILDSTPEVTVSITVPLDQNAWVLPVFFAGRSVTASITMRRERYTNAFVP